jgi:hypothetical protein
MSPGRSSRRRGSRRRSRGRSASAKRTGEPSTPRSRAANPLTPCCLAAAPVLGLTARGCCPHARAARRRVPCPRSRPSARRCGKCWYAHAIRQLRSTKRALIDAVRPRRAGIVPFRLQCVAALRSTITISLIRTERRYVLQAARYAAESISQASSLVAPLRRRSSALPATLARPGNVCCWGTCRARRTVTCAWRRVRLGCFLLSPSSFAIASLGPPPAAPPPAGRPSSLSSAAPGAVPLLPMILSTLYRLL